MTEIKISEEIIKVMDYLGEKIGVAVDWTSKDVLPLLQEICAKYISWEIATSIVWIILGTLLFLIGLVSICKFIKYVDKNDWLSEAIVGFMLVLVIVCILPSLLIIIVQIFDILKCNYLPELQIYQYISKLIRVGE